MDDELAQAEAEVEELMAEHDLHTAEGLAFWQETMRDTLDDMGQQVRSVLASVMTGKCALGDLTADESRILVGYLVAVANAFTIFVLAPQDYLRALMADATPVYTENLEA